MALLLSAFTNHSALDGHDCMNIEHRGGTAPVYKMFVFNELLFVADVITLTLRYETCAQIRMVLPHSNAWFASVIYAIHSIISVFRVHRIFACGFIPMETTQQRIPLFTSNESENFLTHICIAYDASAVCAAMHLHRDRNAYKLCGGWLL